MLVKVTITAQHTDLSRLICNAVDALTHDAYLRQHNRFENGFVLSFDTDDISKPGVRILIQDFFGDKTSLGKEDYQLEFIEDGGATGDAPVSADAEDGEHAPDADSTVSSDTSEGIDTYSLRQQIDSLNAFFAGSSTCEDADGTTLGGSLSECGDVSDDATEVQQKASSMRKVASATLADIRDRINAVAGGEAFKKLADEIVSIAPQILSSDSREVLLSRSYLLSINDGYGLQNYLRLFSELIASLHLFDSSEPGEVTVASAKHEKGGEIFADELDRLYIPKGSFAIACLDISEVMNDVWSTAFSAMLRSLRAKGRSVFYFFRIPYVDSEVQKDVYRAISDVMTVSILTFPPFSQEEIRRCASVEFERLHFRLAEGAWGMFQRRITEEKNDGRFYGIDTITKVVREFVYQKLIANAVAQNESKEITCEDVASICSTDDREEVSGYDMLDRLIGGERIKQRVIEIISQIQYSRAQKNLKAPCIHMKFVGNPGTGKTTVARIIGQILKEKGVLRVGGFYECSGRDLCGRYIGETAPKTAGICRDAYGSVLFIDEAYSLYRGDSDRDYGREALDTLIAEMENHRTDLVVIMAGYTDEMETMMKGNAGLASRVPYTLEFPNFTRDELYRIFVTILGTQIDYDDDLLPAVKEYINALPGEVLEAKEFSNARFIRNLFERTFAKAATRSQMERQESVRMTATDFNRAICDTEFRFENMSRHNVIGFH